MESYDVIFVGYPNWWGTMPMAVFTFMEGYLKRALLNVSSLCEVGTCIIERCGRKK